MTPIRAALSGASLIILTLAAPEARADETAVAALRSVIAQIDASPAWKASARKIGSDGNAAVAEGLVIAAEHGTATASIDDLKVEGFKLADGAYRFDHLTLTAVSAQFDTVRVTLPGLTASDASLPDLGGFVPDEKAPAGSFGRLLTSLSGLRFAAIEIPLVSASTGSGDFMRTSELQSLRLDTMAAGVLGRASFASYKVKQSVLQGPVVPFQTGAGEAAGLGIGALAAVFDPSSYKDGKGDGVWRPLLDSFSLTSAAADNGRLTAQHVGLTGLSVRQTAEPPSTLVDAMAAFDPPGQHEEQMFALMEKRAPDLLGWLRLGKFSIEGINTRLPEGGALSAAAFGLDDLSPDGVKRVALEKLRFDTPTLVGGLQLAAMEDIAWPSARSLLLAARLGEAGDKGLRPSDAELEDIAAHFIEVFPSIARLDIRGVEGGAPGQPPLSLGHYGWEMKGPLAFPDHVVAKVEDIVIPGAYLRLDPESAALFDALGYDQLRIGIDQTADSDPQSGDYSSTLAIAVEQAGRLSAGLELGGITRAAVNKFLFASLKSQGHDPSEAEILEAFAGFTFKSIRLRFEDQSLTGRLVPYLAKQQGLGEDAFKTNTVAMTQLGLASFGSPSLTTAAANALQSFLDKPKSLTISVKPAKPLGLADFEAMNPNDPSAMVEKLGIAITAND